MSKTDKQNETEKKEILGVPMEDSCGSMLRRILSIRRAK